MVGEAGEVCTECEGGSTDVSMPDTYIGRFSMIFYGHTGSLDQKYGGNKLGSVWVLTIAKSAAPWERDSTGRRRTSDV
jgi:hypothetical protein